MIASPIDPVQLESRYSQDNSKIIVLTAPSQKKEYTSLGALANAAYALTALMAAFFNLGAYRGDINVLLAVALANGGLTQFICGFIEFRRGNIFGGTAFSSFGAYWISFFVYFIILLPNVDPGARHLGEGYYNLSWCIFTLYMTIASFKVDIPTFVLFATLELTYLFLCLGSFLRITVLLRVAGASGVVSAGCGFYLSAKDVIFATFKSEDKKEL